MEQFFLILHLNFKFVILKIVCIKPELSFPFLDNFSAPKEFLFSKT